MAPLPSRFRLHHPAPAVFQLSLLYLLALLLSIAQSIIPSLPTSFVSADINMADIPAAGSSSVYKSNYTRSNEVQQQCQPHLEDLATDPSFWREAGSEKRRWILNELTFLNGVWVQERAPNISKVRKPLMPFFPEQGHSVAGPSVIKEPMHLVSSWITDVQLPFNGVPPSPKGSILNVSAVLQVSISSQGSLSIMVSPLHGFAIVPGLSRLVILMEGVYAELNNGERLLCLLGSTKIPSRGKNESHPWDWLTYASLTRPPLAYDSKIMAVLHFPKELSLTSRAVAGRLQSLQAPTHPNYFDPIGLFSEMGASAHYHFKSGDLVRSACGSPRRPGEVSSPKNLYQGSSVCTVMQGLLGEQWVDILPNWNCTLSKTTCMKLGPFQSSLQHELKSTILEAVRFNGAQLLVQDIRCVDYPEDGSFSANISAVFRAVFPSANQMRPFGQTSLDGLTLVAEGRWNSNSGQLCMVGCRGGMTASSSQTSIKEACNTKITIYISLTLSLSQRNILRGSISSSSGSSDDFYPLSFHLPLDSPLYSWQIPFDLAQNITYEYTKIKEARALQEQDELVGLGDSIKKSLLKYPSSANHGGDIMVLSHDLSLQTFAITYRDWSNDPRLQHFIQISMFAIEDRVTLPWMQFAEVAAPKSTTDDEVYKKVDEQNSFYRVATRLKVTDNLGNKVMAIAAEGVYDPTVGRSYLLGCREVNAPWKTFQENAELLEEGLDCKIVLKVEYPPTNARWFMNPTVLLTVTSRRREDDPFFFPKISIETFPILYQRQSEDIVPRKSLEGGLSILSLSLVLGCIVSQLMYVKTHAGSTRYISLVMLGVQAAGFSISLITGIEALSASRRSDSDGMVSVSSEGRWSHVVVYMMNMLTLANLLLTVILMQKVYESRTRMLSRRPLELLRLPSDIEVLTTCAGVHALGFGTVLIIHPVSLSMSTDLYNDWKRILKEYYDLVQDLFLLPQVVGNHLWVVKGKTLRMLFYVGVTVLRLLPHLYDGLRPPVSNAYSASSDFYSKITGGIAIPALAVLLACVIYIQQQGRNGAKRRPQVPRQGSSFLPRYLKQRRLGVPHLDKPT